MNSSAKVHELLLLAKMSIILLNNNCSIKLISSNVVKQHGLLNAKLFIFLDAILLKAVQPTKGATYKKHNVIIRIRELYDFKKSPR
jgi:hypothetical protein